MIKQSMNVNNQKKNMNSMVNNIINLQKQLEIVKIVQDDEIG